MAQGEEDSLADEADSNMTVGRDQSEDHTIALAQRQSLPRAVVRIHTVSVDAVRGEEDLQEKPLQELIVSLQEDDPFVAEKRAAM